MSLEAGAKLVTAETFGDWYRDPWGWPELRPEFVKQLDGEQDLLIRRNDAGEYVLSLPPFFHLIEVPKSRLGVRPAVVQDPLSRLAYLSAVHTGLTSFERFLPDWVFGWRSRGDSGLGSAASEWSSYVATLPGSEQEGYGLLTDITSCFASISPDKLEPVVYERLGKVAAASVIMGVVRAHASLSTRSGLPQRSFGSAILAHAVLQPIDDALAAAQMSDGVVAVRRWMDDISAEGDEAALFQLLLDLQERARQIGLELNSSKTHLSPAATTAAALRVEDLREIEVPVRLVGGEYGAEPVEEPDLQALHALEAGILTRPESVSRTVARAALVSLTKNAQFGRATEWMAAAKSLPHVADTLGRYLRGSADAEVIAWPDLGEWFERYQETPWGKLDWVASQYALAFPADQLPRQVRAVLRHWLETSADLQKIAVATQRLASSEPTLARALMRARLDRTADPLLLRVFGLGLLMSGDSRASVESILARDPRNRLLQRYLAETAWRTPSVVRDFDLASSDV